MKNKYDRTYPLLKRSFGFCTIELNTSYHSRLCQRHVWPVDHSQDTPGFYL